MSLKKISSKAKKAVANFKERKAAKRRLRQRRKIAVERGRKGISVDLVFRIIEGVKKQTAGKPREEFLNKLEKSFGRLIAKTALDTFGILNAPDDPRKRERIQEIMERMGHRVFISEGIRRGRRTDLVMDSELEKLGQELGGKKKVRQFLLKYAAINEDIEKKLRQLEQ